MNEEEKSRKIGEGLKLLIETDLDDLSREDGGPVMEYKRDRLNKVGEVLKNEVISDYLTRGEFKHLNNRYNEIKNRFSSELNSEPVIKSPNESVDEEFYHLK